MRLLKWLSITTGVVVVSLFLLAFTVTGNDILVSWVNSYLKSQVKEAKVEVISLRLSTSDIKLKAKINDVIALDSYGLFNLWRQEFNVAYALRADKIQTPTLQINEKIEIKGTAKGNLDDMSIKGKGKAFKSDISYDLRLLHYTPKQIRIRVKEASISDILAVGSLPHYSSGKLSIMIDMPELDPQNPQGNGEIEIEDGVLNHQAILKDFNISLPKDTHYSANVFVKTEASKIGVEGKLLSDLAEIEIKEGIYALEDKRVGGNYSLNLKQLGGLETLTTLPLRGTFALQGSVKKVGERIRLSGITHSLGGTTTFLYQGDKLSAEFKEMQPQKLLYLLKQPNYLQGKINGKINLSSIAARKGAFDMVFKGDVQTKRVKKMWDIDLGKKLHMTLHTKGTLDKAQLLAQSSLKTTLGNLSLSQVKYHLQSNDFKMNYLLDIAKLSRLMPLTNLPMRGSFKLNGTLQQDKGSLIGNGKTKSFGGLILADYKNNALKVRLKEVENRLLAYKLKQPHYMTGTSNMRLNISDVKAMRGSFEAQVKGGVKTAVVRKHLDIDLGKSFFVNLQSKGVMTSQKVTATTTLKSTMGRVTLSKSSYTFKDKVLRSPYRIEIPNLAKLKPLIGKAYRGDMIINGQITQGKNLTVTGQGKEFGGSIAFKLVNDRLHANVKGATVSKVMYMLDYPQVIDARSKATIHYNLSTKKGKINATLDNTRVLPTQLTQLLKEFAKIDIGKERFNNVKFLATLSKPLVGFSLDAKSHKSYIKLLQGKLFHKSGKLDGKIEAYIRGKAFNARLYGTIENPRIKLDTEALIKEKASKELNKLIEKKLKLPKGEVGEALKGVLEGLF